MNILQETRKAYTEVGIGNRTFISTEIEHPDGSETRQLGFVRFTKVKAVYARFWLGRKVYILDSKERVLRPVQGMAVRTRLR